MNNPSTFSVNGAADLLERDRRTIRRALAMVPPDAKETGSPRWRLRTILDALAAHERRTGHERPRAHDGGRDAVLEEIEQLSAKLDAGFNQMAAEPDMARRREMATEVGPLVGALNRTIARSHEFVPPDERPFVKLGTDQILRQAIANFMGLCQYELYDDDGAADAARQQTCL
jgi:hypothetical protein